MCAGFLAANPYALLDHHAFRDGLEKQTETAGEEGGKLGLANTLGLALLPRRPARGASAGCRRCSRSAAPPACSPATAGSACCSRPRRCCCSSTSATSRASSRAGCCPSTRSSACSRPGACRRRDLARAPLQPARRRSRLAAVARCCSPRASSSASTTTSCWPGRHAHGRPRAGWSRTSRRARRSSSSRSPPTSGRPTPGSRLRQAHRQRQPLEQVAHVALVRRQRRHADHERRVPRGQARGLRAHDAPGARRLLRARRVLLGRHGLDAVRPRLRRPATRSRTRCATTTSCASGGDVVFRISPYGQRPTCRSRSTTRSTTTR